MVDSGQAVLLSYHILIHHYTSLCFNGRSASLSTLFLRATTFAFYLTMSAINYCSLNHAINFLIGGFMEKFADFVFACEKTYQFELSEIMLFRNK